MSGLEPILFIASTVLSVAGAVQQGIAQRAAARNAEIIGRHQRALAEREAEVLEQRAGQERAVSQREAIEQRRQGRFVESRIQAVSAASGAGALDPTIVNILGEVGSEVEVRALTALAGGEQSALNLEFGAELERAGGEGDLFAALAESRAQRAKARRSFIGAGGTLLEGGTSFADKFPGFFKKNFRFG